MSVEKSRTAIAYCVRNSVKLLLNSWFRKRFFADFAVLGLSAKILALADLHTV